jgi:hypothetical protein
MVVGTRWHLLRWPIDVTVAESRGPYELHVTSLSYARRSLICTTTKILPPSLFLFSCILWLTSSHLLGGLNLTRTPSLRRTDALSRRHWRNNMARPHSSVKAKPE